LVKSAKSLDISVDSFLAEDRRKAGRTVGATIAVEAAIKVKPL
jgi:hypothetical protein